MLTCALTLLAGLAQAQQPAPAEAPAAMPAEQAVADATTMPVPSAPVAAEAAKRAGLASTSTATPPGMSARMLSA